MDNTDIIARLNEIYDLISEDDVFTRSKVKKLITDLGRKYNNIQVMQIIHDHAKERPRHNNYLAYCYDCKDYLTSIK